MGRSSSRGKIIEAAEKVVARVGAAHLTLDAVAEEAGVSKGGLLYHFKSKDELIKAILHEHINAKITAMEEQKRLAQSENCSELEAHLKGIINSLCGDCCDRETGVALLAVIANNPGLMEPFEEYFEKMVQQICGKKSDFNAEAAILWLATEGIRFHYLLNRDPFDATQRDQVIAKLLELGRDISPKP